jgi:8-oxo-dGTP pyrophosphatase MutT (NUDIX family)
VTHDLTSTPGSPALHPDEPDAARWKVHRRRTKYESEWVNVYLDDVELPDGTHIDHHVLAMPKASQTAIVLNDARDHVLLIWRHRFITDKWGWEVPAGWVEPGEDRKESIRREILEETGYEVKKLDRFIEYDAIPGLSSMHFAAWMATAGERVQEPDKREVTDVEWIPIHDIGSLTTNGLITDGPSVIAVSLLLALQHGVKTRNADTSPSSVLDYARELVPILRSDMHWVSTEYTYGGYWKTNDTTSILVMVARATAAIEFLRQYAGADSLWAIRANELYLNKGENQSIESGVRAVGDLIEAWINQVESGIAEVVGAKSRQEVGQLSTDLMVQVRQLIEDRRAHPAAAIVLCGAALEIALRAVTEAHQLDIEERPTISAYVKACRRAELLTKQDVKDIEQIAGMRNSAAHGEFADLSAERAALMEQQTNLMIRRLSDLI